MHGDPDVTAAWEPRVLQDDPVTQSNQEGFVSFATGGPNTRSTQLFISLRDNARLDAMGFAPIGQVVSGMNVVHQLYGGYGEGAPGGSGPDQGRIRDQGNVYLNRFYPRLDSIVRARVVRD
jgi:peptidyl-prolyl cis-trans isomerase A (cyclophilin A)